MAGGHPRMPDLSREGPFDVLQDRSDSGASPLVLDGAGLPVPHDIVRRRKWGPDFTPAYGVQLHDPQLLGVRGCAVVSLTAQS